jgi:hypothetical protein
VRHAVQVRSPEGTPARARAECPGYLVHTSRNWGLPGMVESVYLNRKEALRALEFSHNQDCFGALTVSVHTPAGIVSHPWPGSSLGPRTLGTSPGSSCFMWLQSGPRPQPPPPQGRPIPVPTDSYSEHWPLDWVFPAGDISQSWDPGHCLLLLLTGARAIFIRPLSDCLHS